MPLEDVLDQRRDQSGTASEGHDDSHPGNFGAFHTECIDQRGTHEPPEEEAEDDREEKPAGAREAQRTARASSITTTEVKTVTDESENAPERLKVPLADGEPVKMAPDDPWPNVDAEYSPPHGLHPVGDDPTLRELGPA